MQESDPGEVDVQKFFVGTLEKVLQRPPGRIVASQEGSAPPRGAQIPAYFRCSIVLEGRHLQQSDLGAGPEDFSLRAGDIFLMRPDTWRVALSGPRRRVLVIFFLPRHLSLSCYEFATVRRADGIQRNFSTSRGLPTAASLLLGTVVEYTRQRPFPKACVPLVRCLLEETWEVLRSDKVSLTKAEITFLALCNYVEERFREPISRESAADFLQIHPVHVSRLFRAVGETTFQKYVLERRLKYATGLLSRSSLSIKEIAAASGFQSPDYFREVFCQSMGETPRNYRSSAALQR